MIKRPTFVWMVLATLATGCASVSEPPPLLVAKPNHDHQPVAVNYAYQLLGKPYRYGKADPDEGFDCSGLVYHVYQRQGITLPRTSREMAARLPAIPKQAVQAGDLVFFDTDGKVFSHVGIYVNDGQFIHAPSRRSGKVMLSDLTDSYWQNHYIAARRPALSRPRTTLAR